MIITQTVSYKIEPVFAMCEPDFVLLMAVMCMFQWLFAKSRCHLQEDQSPARDDDNRVNSVSSEEIWHQGNSQWWSLQTRVVSRDMVFHVSVLVA